MVDAGFRRVTKKDSRVAHSRDDEIVGFGEAGAADSLGEVFEVRHLNIYSIIISYKPIYSFRLIYEIQTISI